MRLLAALILIVWSGAAVAQTRARSVEDCEKIRSAHEYNLCLASFSPRVGQRRARVRGEPAQERTVARSGRSQRYVTRRGGRQSAVFEVRGSRNRADVRTYRRR